MSPNLFQRVARLLELFEGDQVTRNSNTPKPVPVPKKPQTPPAPPSISSYSREEVINPRTGRKYIGARPLPGRVGARRLVRDDDGRRHWVHVNDLDNDWDVYFDGR